MQQPDFFVAIDFDGTIVAQDVTDAVIQRFSRPGWEIAERLWVEGKIGSRECLTSQISLISASIDEILNYIGVLRVDPSFPTFVNFLRTAAIPFAIISDGFQELIKRVLANSGIDEFPLIIANRLQENQTGLEAIFPYAEELCSAGTCKCAAASKIGGGLPIVLIGDGRSDFCLARNAAYVLSKGKLSAFCAENDIPGQPFKDFSDATIIIQSGIMGALDTAILNRSATIT
jgi:2-hydroxy-3-keto-5-methylthiopentenyl-1-phosphate phosphatase